MQAYDLHLLGIPGSWRIIASSNPYPRTRFSGLTVSLEKVRHADAFSVARVQPRTSKGITDLLLLNLVRLDAASPSKKNVYRKKDGKPI